MKVTDYIARFLATKGMTEVFGYPGGMVTHLMDSLAHEPAVHAHLNYHEQACAFAACAYAQIAHRPGMSFATSGPGATNLITGICNAYFDSIPVLFITGQVNTGELKIGYSVRQRGFQETDIVSIVAPVTKFAACVREAAEVPAMLQRAYDVAVEGRPGPVLVDIPMDVQRADISVVDEDIGAAVVTSGDCMGAAEAAMEALRAARRPCLLLGAGIHAAGAEAALGNLLEKWNLPVITTMPSVDLLPSQHPMNYGFLGAYGDRTANFIAAKSDLVLSIGARLDIRQTGVHRESFAPHARILRVDVDAGELSYCLHAEETQIPLDAGDFIKAMCTFHSMPPKLAWIAVCNEIREKLATRDDLLPNHILRAISQYIDVPVVTTDVGQNQVWAAQSWDVRPGQRVLFSAGHGAMGYALPAAIGAYYACQKPVVCLCGDGGLQMNIQELAVLARDKLPIMVIVMNNHALGMIRQFQEMYFDARYTMTLEGYGYAAPDFCAVADGYGLKTLKISNLEDIAGLPATWKEPYLVEVEIRNPTYVYPKLEFGKSNQDQEPLLDRETYDEIMEL